MVKPERARAAMAATLERIERASSPNLDACLNRLFRCQRRTFELQGHVVA
jgi:hypothetical protein